MAQVPSTVQAGTLDPTFAEEGVLTLPTPELIGFFTLAILPLAENKLLITVLLPGDPAPIRLARVNEDGSIDMEFGSAGTGLVEFSIKNTNLPVYQLRGLSDGGWLAIGQFSSSEHSGVYVVRFLEDGQLNTLFGENGVRLLPYRNEPRDEDRKDGPATLNRRDQEPSAGDTRSSGNQGFSAVVQPDGKIVLPSWVDFGPSRGQWAVLRLNPDGSTDYTFNGSGFVVIALPGIPRHPISVRSMVLQADGQVLVSGEYSSQETPDSNGIYVIRLDAAGRLDTSFNGGVGIVTVANPTFMNANAMALRESDGAIVVVGDIWRDQRRHGLVFVLSRDGFFDFAFNNGQPLISKLVDQGHDWYRCAWQADGSILVGGTTGRGLVEEGVLALTARLRADGSLDLTFNGTGFVLFDEDGQYEAVQDMALMPDGRIVVGGFAQLPSPVWSRIVGSWIIRYLA